MRTKNAGTETLVMGDSGFSGGRCFWEYTKNCFSEQEFAKILVNGGGTTNSPEYYVIFQSNHHLHNKSN